MKNILALVLFLSATMLFAHGDEPHADEKKKAPESAAYFTVYSESQRYELVLRYPEITPGSPVELTLYLSDFATNRPIADADIVVSVQEDASVMLAVDMHEPGVYHLNGTFPKAQAYSLTFKLNSKLNGPDLQLLKSVEVGKKLPKPENTAETHSHSGISMSMALTFAAGLLGGVLLMFFFRSKPRAAAVLLVALSVPSLFQNAAAHGDEDHKEDKKGGTGNSIFIHKETQFLFDMLTQQVGTGDFSPAIKLYGTIVPAPSGFAGIVAPQSGKLLSLKVQPGQRVVAGQIVATLKPTVGQSDQVGVAVETGRLNADLQAARAELVAAEREKNRLQAIADVAAKKDVQAAEARFNAARANLDALQSVAAGANASSAGIVLLRSPVAGVVGQFTLAPGAEVQAGNILFEVTNLSKVYVEAQVYDRDATLVHDAGKFTATCSNDDHKTAEVRLVSTAQSVNPSNQSQRVLFELSNPDGEFKIGEFVTLEAFQKKTARQIFVPNSALSEINGKPVVFLKDGPEMYAVSYVSLGEDNGTHTVVLKGIEEGERFVTTGTYQVKMMLLNE